MVRSLGVNVFVELHQEFNVVLVLVGWFEVLAVNSVKYQVAEELCWNFRL